MYVYNSISLNSTQEVVQKINCAVLEIKWKNTAQPGVKDNNTAHALCKLDN
jgi:hypothetical protein